MDSHSCLVCLHIPWYVEFYLIRWDVLGLNVLEPQSVRKGADLAITPVCIFNVTK